MKKLLLLIFVFISLNCFSQWQNVNTPSSSSQRLEGVHFINDSIGFILSNDSNLIYKTVDAGTNWTTINQISLPIGINDLKIFGISFPSDSVGYSLFASTTTHNAFIYKTIDQGNTWSLSKSIYIIGGYDPTNINFIDNEHGMIFFRKSLFITKNGGATWDSTFISNSVYQISMSVFDTSRVRIDYLQQYNWIDSVIYSNNFGNSFIGLQGDAYFSSVDTKDSITYGFRYNNQTLYKSTNYGLTWNSIYNFNGKINNISSIYIQSEDTVFIRGENFIYRSDDSGLTWGNQISSYSSSYNRAPFINEFSQTENYLYSINETDKALIRTSNLGGTPLPLLSLSPSSYYGQCPGDTLFVQNTNNQSFDYYWTLNGNIIDTSNDLTFIIPEGSSSHITYDIYLVVHNGNEKDSLKLEVKATPSPNPPPFNAWIDSYVNCDGSYNLMVSPISISSTFNYLTTYSYKYYDGITHYNLGNQPTSINGDTALYKITFPVDSIISVRAQASNCGGGFRDVNLTLPPQFYGFDIYPAIFNKEIYCTYDTVFAKIPNSVPGALYSLINNSNYTKVGTGDTIELKGVINPNYGAGLITRNYNIYYSNNNCQKNTTNNTIKVEYAYPKFDLIPDNQLNYNSPFYFNLGDTVFFDFFPDSVTTSCYWQIESDLFDTSYYNFNDNFIITSQPGYYSVKLTKTSNTGCVYSDSLNFSVNASQQPFSQNLNCDYDTTFNTSYNHFDYYNNNMFHTLDIHKDLNNNYHKIGFRSTSINSNTQVLFHNKYNKDRQLIYSHQRGYYNISAYYSSNYKGEALTSVTTDSILNVYLTGVYINEGSFRYDSIGYVPLYINSINSFAFLAKHDSLNRLNKLILFTPTVQYSSSSPSSANRPQITSDFSDILYHNNKIYTILNASVKGDIVKYNKQNNSWTTITNINPVGYYLMEFDTLLNLLNMTQVSPSSSTQGFPFLNTGKTTNTRGAKLTLDKQNRILIHYFNDIKRSGSNSISNNNIQYGNNILISSNSFINYLFYCCSSSFNYFASAIATYDLSNGWVQGNIVGLGELYNHNNVINNTETDDYGNKYILTSYKTSNSTYSLSALKKGIINNDTISKLKSAISKFNVNGVPIWSIYFQNCEVIDMKMTKNQKHIGVIVNLDFFDNKFYFGKSPSSMNTVEAQDYSSVFMQFSHNGELEKMYKYGNDVKKVSGQFLDFDDDGYFNFHTNFSNTDSTVLIINGDSITNFSTIQNSSTYSNYNYIKFTIDGENGQCNGPAYPGRLNDTLFLHPQNMDLCHNSTIFIPWIATDTISSVNLGYYLNNDTTKYYIANNLNATDYGYNWNLPLFNNLDSIKFFIEDNSALFYHETNTYVYYDNQNIILPTDTTICYGIPLEISPIDTIFDLTWFPSQSFSNPELDSTQIILLQDTTQIIVHAKTTNNSCTYKDTINVNILPLANASFTPTFYSSSFSAINQSTNYDSLEWHITNNPPIYNQDSIHINYTVPNYNICLIAKNTCNQDTTCFNVNIHYSSYDTLSICMGDSVYLQNDWQSTWGNYVDTLNSILNIDSVVQTTLYIIPNTYVNDSLSICQNDSIFLEGNYQNTSGIYYDTLQTILGCDSIISTTLTVSPAFVTQQNSSICQNDSIFLSGSYQNTSGTYYDSLQTILGCDSLIETILVVNSLPAVNLNSFNPDTLCNNSNPVSLPIGTPSGGIYSGNGISGNDFNPSSVSIGTHNIIYTFTDNNSCINSDTTSVYVVLCTNIEDVNVIPNIRIYPNPNTGKFIIEKINEFNQSINVKLLDGNSKLIIDKTILNNQNIIEFDITNYSKGLYYLHIIIDNNTFVKKILKN